jgi:CRP-like cAMP-binding protein
VTTQDLLAQTSVFGALDAPDLAALAAACRARRFAPGAVLFHVEDPGDTLYVIRSGQVKVVLETPGADHILCLCGPGDCLGELSLLDGKPRSATVIAIDALEALALYRQDFRALMEQRPTIGCAMLVRLAEMVRRTNGHVQDILSLDSTARIAKKLLELAECHGEATEDGMRITLPLTQRDLGQMVGVTREKINRALEEFEQGGVLTNGRHRITIQRPELLRKRID